MPKLSIPKKEISRVVTKYDGRTIKTIAEVKSFLKDCIHTLNLNFHPDTDFNDYLNSNGNSFFNKAQVIIMNEANGQCFDVCNKRDADYYDIGLNEFIKTFKTK